MERNRPRAVWRTAAVLTAYTLLAVAVLRPTPRQLAHTAPAFHGFANDALIYVWALAHVSRTLFTDPLHVFDAPIFHPAGLTLAYSDHVIGQALVGLPIWLATENPLLEFNLLVLASYVLGGTATFAYARAIGAGTVGAFAAGLVFAFNPYRFHSPLWLQVIFTPFIPLALLAWLRFVRSRTLIPWIAWVACWTLHGLMGMYLGLYFTIVMGALIVFTAVATPPPRDRRLLIGLFAAPVVTGLLLAPTLLPYVVLRTTQGHVRTFGLDTPLEFFLPGPGTVSARLLGTELLGRWGPGLSVWALALVGLLTWERHRVRGGLPATFVHRAHLIGLATTLLLVLVPLRFQLLVPGLDMIRATNRAFYLSLFFLGLFAADGVDRLTRGPRARLIGVALLLVLLADMGTPPRERLPLPTASDMPEAYRVLRDLPDDAVVYERVDGPEPLGRAMYFQTFHRKRMPTGYAGFWNPASEFVVHRLYRFPAPESLRLLRMLGVSHVLQHFQNEAAAATARDDPQAGLAIVRRAGADVVFRVDPLPATPDEAVTPLPRDAWTATTSNETATLAALADGDPATQWTVLVPRGVVPSVTLDLKTARPIAGLRITTPLDRAAGVQWSRVELSENGRDFTLAPAGFEPDSLAALYGAPNTVRYWEARFPPRPARWVRLSNSELAFWGGEWTIAELDVLVPAAP